MYKIKIDKITTDSIFIPDCRCTQGKVNYREKEKEVLDNILGGYDARIRPSGENATGEYG